MERGFSLSFYLLSSRHGTSGLRDKPMSRSLAVSCLLCKLNFLIYLFNHLIGQEHDVLRRASVVAYKMDGLAFHGHFFGDREFIFGLARVGQSDNGHADDKTGCCCVGYPASVAVKKVLVK